jgi:sigma-B regulation protein RsbU (phosphoserine phosphatase)
MIGADLDVPYETLSCPVDDFARLYLFSDGVYEITKTDGKVWPFRDFLAFMTRGPESGEPEATIERLIAHTARLSGTDEYQDDFSIVEFQFPGPA